MFNLAVLNFVNDDFVLFCFVWLVTGHLGGKCNRSYNFNHHSQKRCSIKTTKLKSNTNLQNGKITPFLLQKNERFLWQGIKCPIFSYTVIKRHLTPGKTSSTKTSLRNGPKGHISLNIRSRFVAQISEPDPVCEKWKTRLRVVLGRLKKIPTKKYSQLFTNVNVLFNFQKQR